MSVKNGHIISLETLVNRLIVHFTRPKTLSLTLNVLYIILTKVAFLSPILLAASFDFGLNFSNTSIIYWILIFWGHTLIVFLMGLSYFIFGKLGAPIAKITKKLDNYDTQKHKSKLRYWLHEEYITDNVGREIPFHCLYQAVGIKGFCLLIVKPNTLSDECPPQPIKFRIANGLQMSEVLYVLNSRIKKYSLDN